MHLLFTYCDTGMHLCTAWCCLTKRRHAEALDGRWCFERVNNLPSTPVYWGITWHQIDHTLISVSNTIHIVTPECISALPGAWQRDVVGCRSWCNVPVNHLLLRQLRPGAWSHFLHQIPTSLSFTRLVSIFYFAMTKCISFGATWQKGIMIFVHTPPHY